MKAMLAVMVMAVAATVLAQQTNTLATSRPAAAAKAKTDPVMPASLKMGLIAYYPFDGDAKDASGNGHHGIPSNVVLTNDVRGRANSAYYFNGVNAQIECGNLIPSLPRFAICAWLRIDSCTDANYMGPWGQQDFIYPAKPSNQYAMFTSLNGSFGSTWRWARKKDLVDSRVDHPLQIGEWHLIVQTCDGASVRQYDNGRLVNKCSASGKALGNTCSFIIGSVAAYPARLCRTWFHGCIDEVRVYKRALSAQEISQLYANMKP